MNQINVARNERHQFFKWVTAVSFIKYWCSTKMYDQNQWCYERWKIIHRIYHTLSFDCAAATLRLLLFSMFEQHCWWQNKGAQNCTNEINVTMNDEKQFINSSQLDFQSCCSYCTASPFLDVWTLLVATKQVAQKRTNKINVATNDEKQFIKFIAAWFLIVLQLLHSFFFSRRSNSISGNVTSRMKTIEITVAMNDEKQFIKFITTWLLMVMQLLHGFLLVLNVYSMNVFRVLVKQQWWVHKKQISTKTHNQTNEDVLVLSAIACVADVFVSFVGLVDRYIYPSTHQATVARVQKCKKYQEDWWALSC